MGSMWRSWRKWAATLKEDTYALYLASRDPRVPWTAKAVLAVVVAYALSPIDLIPDFVPVLGLLDDMVLLPLGIALAVRLIPPDIWKSCKEQARGGLAQGLPGSLTGAIVIAIIWIATIGVVALLAWRSLGGGVRPKQGLQAIGKLIF